MKFVRTTKTEGVRMIKIDTKANQKRENETKSNYTSLNDRNWLLDDLTKKTTKNGKFNY